MVSLRSTRVVGPPSARARMKVCENPLGSGQATANFSPSQAKRHGLRYSYVSQRFASGSLVIRSALPSQARYRPVRSAILASSVADVERCPTSTGQLVGFRLLT